MLAWSFVVVWSCLSLAGAMAQFAGSDDLTRADLGPKPACYDDLDILLQWVETKESPDEDFILCPNTVFTVGYPYTVGRFNKKKYVCCQNGTNPLVVRQGVRYMCGEDGKSSNNCTITSGEMQIISHEGMFIHEEKTNVRVEGVTFENGGVSGAVLAADGDVTFTDCVFRVSAPRKTVNSILTLVFL